MTPKLTSLISWHLFDSCAPLEIKHMGNAFKDIKRVYNLSWKVQYLLQDINIVYNFHHPFLNTIYWSCFGAFVVSTGHKYWQNMFRSHINLWPLAENMAARKSKVASQLASHKCRRNQQRCVHISIRSFSLSIFWWITPSIVCVIYVIQSEFPFYDKWIMWR